MEATDQEQLVLGRMKSDRTEQRTEESQKDYVKALFEAGDEYSSKLFIFFESRMNT